MKGAADPLAAAQKRNFAEAASSAGGDADVLDAKEAAWASVFAAGKSTAAESEEEARKRKYARKAEKRKEKMAAQDANAANLTLYVTGIPKDVSWTAVQSLFARAGEVRRVKLYKDESGEQKGDGVVTFANEDGVNAAVGRDWDLFGETLKVERASFQAKPTGVPKEDWSRVVVLLHMFSTEELATLGEPVDIFLSRLQDEIWLECLKFGKVERVECFAADPQCASSIRFESAEAASACIAAMEGRWFNERQLSASLFDGHRKRAPPPEDDTERMERLKRPVEPPQMPPPGVPDADGFMPSSSSTEPLEQAELKRATQAGASQIDAGSTSFADDVIVLPSGGYVKLRGLKSAPERNGSVGVIQGAPAEDSGRYTVQLRDGTQLALKRSNLLQMLAVTVMEADGDNASHNGKKGTIFEHDETAGMYGVELENEEAIPLAVGQVKFADGAIGTVDGLQSESARQYNGSLAKVLSYDAAAGRFVCLIDAGKELRLKRANLLD